MYPIKNAKGKPEWHKDFPQQQLPSRSNNKTCTYKRKLKRIPTYVCIIHVCLCKACYV